MCALMECTWYFEDPELYFSMSELKDSIFHDTWLIFVNYIAIFVRALHFFATFTCLVAKFIRSQYRKNVLSLAKRIHGVRGNTLLVAYLFIWASWKWKKQYYTFNVFSILQLLAKDNELFLKKTLKFFSRPIVFSLYNSESSPKILHFFYNSNYQIV